MKSYDSMPKSGTARKIWRVLEENGFTVIELHYNPNCYGRGKNDGWGTWACNVISPEKSHISSGELLCGLYGGRIVYIQGMSAPYESAIVGYTSTECPFYTKRPYERCKYPSIIGEPPRR
jgi:hypothetical protein